jgi:hypothetical protein
MAFLELGLQVINPEIVSEPQDGLGRGLHSEEWKGPAEQA